MRSTELKKIIENEIEIAKYERNKNTSMNLELYLTGKIDGLLKILQEMEQI